MVIMIVVDWIYVYCIVNNTHKNVKDGANQNQKENTEHVKGNNNILGPSAFCRNE